MDIGVYHGVSHALFYREI